VRHEAKKSGNKTDGTESEETKVISNVADVTIGKVIFYLENSESMFGYLNGSSQYVDVVSELSEKPLFVAEDIKREFILINGGDLKINNIGDNPVILKSKLNKSGFNCGDITKSNLNGMFQLALEKAKNDTITLLISDGIYDIEQPMIPLNNLEILGKETRSKFIKRLQNGDLETILIKLVSDFNGEYYYSSRHGKNIIKGPRPFYIWIFGKSELLNKYFTEDYFTQSLKGYKDYARFLTIKDNNIPYQITPSVTGKGSFRPDHKDKYKLVNVAPERHGAGFQFSFAVDFSSLPFPDSYLTSITNYSSNLSYNVIKVEAIKNSQKFQVIDFKNPTHIITVFTNKSPYGKLEISLKNQTPNWINETNINDESIIDSTHTFGFGYLTNGITDAYSYINGSKPLATFQIEISK